MKMNICRGESMGGCFCLPRSMVWEEIHCCSCQSMQLNCGSLLYRSVPVREVSAMRLERSLSTPSIRLPLVAPSSEISSMKQKTSVNGLESDKNGLKFGIDAILGLPSPNKSDTTNVNDRANSNVSTNAVSPDTKTKQSKIVRCKRAVFSGFQRIQLESEFLAHKYISKQERKQLSNRLGLTESQIRIWFQNRRMKWRNLQEREMMRNRRFQYFRLSEQSSSG